MRVILLFSLIGIFLPLQGIAQSSLLANSKRDCGTVPYIEALEQRHPEFKQAQQEVEKAIQQVLQKKQEGQYLQQATITIPVVFHILIIPLQRIFLRNRYYLSWLF
jgi:hypothetical protein